MTGCLNIPMEEFTQSSPNLTAASRGGQHDADKEPVAAAVLERPLGVA